MLAPFATLIFLATLLFVTRMVAEMIEESGGRMLAALRGQPYRTEARIPAMRMRVRAPRPARPMRVSQKWRAAA